MYTTAYRNIARFHSSVTGIRSASLALLLLFPLTSASQTEEAKDANSLDTITITSTPFEDRGEDDIAQPVEVIGSDELNRKQAGTIGEIIANEPGISTSDFGQGASQPIIRGQSGPRVQILQNGISSMDAARVSADHAIALEPANATQVEVLKGPATLLYGNGAVGGIVNVVDERIPTVLPDGGEMSLDVGYGENADAGTIAASATVPLGESFALHIGGSSRDTDDYDAFDGQRIANSDLQTDSLSVGGSWVGALGHFGIAVTELESDYGIPGEDARIVLDQSRWDISGSLALNNRLFKRLKLAGGVNDYEHREGENRFSNDEHDVRLELQHQAIGQWQGVIGVQVGDREFSILGDEAFLPPTDTQTTGLFIVENLQTGPWTFELGARAEQVDHSATNNPDTDFDTFSAGAGVIRQINPALSLAVNVGHSERAPVSEELYTFGPHEATATFERGDINLDNEAANHIDVTLRGEHGRLNWSGTLFYNSIDNYVFQDTVDRGINADGTAGIGPGSNMADGQADRVDEDGAFDTDGELLLLDFAQSDADFVGAEFELGFQLSENLSLRGFADIVRAKLDNGEDLPRIPPMRVGLGADWRHGPWQASLDLIEVDDQDRTQALESETDGHTLLNAFAAWDAPVDAFRLQLWLRGNNLLDEEVRRHSSFLKDSAPLPGRAFSAGVRLVY